MLACCPPVPSQELCHLVLLRCWISSGISRDVVMWDFYCPPGVLVGKRRILSNPVRVDRVVGKQCLANLQKKKKLFSFSFLHGSVSPHIEEEDPGSNSHLRINCQLCWKCSPATSGAVVEWNKPCPSWCLWVRISYQEQLQPRDEVWDASGLITVRMEHRCLCSAHM